MAEGRDTPTRGEISETVEETDTEMRERAEALGEVVDDIDIIRQTMEDLDRGGTCEGADDVEQNIAAAEGSAVEVFEKGDQELEAVHEKSQEFARELEDRRDSAGGDRQRILDAGGRVRTPEALDRLAGAKEAAEKDVEFLGEHLDRAQQSHEESELTQSEYHGRVHRQGSSSHGHE